MRRHLQLAALGLGAAVYVWVASVHNSGAVKAKKAARREASTIGTLGAS